MFRKGVDCVIHTKILDPLGRYIILKVAINDKIYILINIYAPNKDKDITCFFTNLLTKLKNENLDDVSSKIPLWLAQGRKDLSDDRVIWDWLKYNIRAHAKQHSKRRAKERNEKRKSF